MHLSCASEEKERLGRLIRILNLDRECAERTWRSSANEQRWKCLSVCIEPGPFLCQTIYSTEPCLLGSHMLSAADAFPDRTPADQRHTQVVVIGDHFSDIDEDDPESEAASQSSDLDRAPGARGGAGSGVVEVGSALPPTALHAPSLVPLQGDVENDDDFRILGQWELNFGHFGGGQDRFHFACACKPS